MRDHPRIDLLALAIEGVPVRETVREIFRDPQNGTPDNISRAGCLALAKSGKVTWNAWRSMFPVSRLNTQYPFKFQNITDFSSQNFKGVLKDLREFNFGDGASFDGSTWGSATVFDGAVFGACSSFLGVVWGECSRFIQTKWGSSCFFDGSSWGSHTSFDDAEWGNLCHFRGVVFGEFILFRNAILGHGADFSGSIWESVSFDGTRFRGDTKFTGSVFKSNVRFLSTQNADDFQEIHFNGCVFKREIDFGQRKFKRKTTFGLIPLASKREIFIRDSAGQRSIEKVDWASYKTIFQYPPVFHGCELHQDTSFEGAVFPKATGSEEAARAYRTLKLAFSEQQAIREEQRFFRLEMEEETLRETGFKYVLFKAYKFCSDYGFSVVRPFTLFIAAWLGFAWIYGFYSGVAPCYSWQSYCTFQSEWLNYSLQQALPLPGLDKLVEEASEVFPPSGAWWGLALSVLVVFHKTISLAMLFLVGLAIRNLFKLK